MLKCRQFKALRFHEVLFFVAKGNNSNLLKIKLIDNRCSRYWKGPVVT